MKHCMELTVNGHTHELFVDPFKSLASVLREDIGLTSVKVGCNSGNCGSCTVLMDGKAVKSCITLALQARGKEITTIEGLASNGRLHPIQQAFIDHFAVQCGFCIPGMILAAKALLDEDPDADEDRVRKGMSGNLCRCTGYVKIVEAILAAKDGIESHTE